MWLFIGLGCLWFAPLSDLWLGPVGQDATLVFVPLAVAAAIRSTMLPALLSAVGSGDFRAFVRPALIEAGANFVASITLGIRYGAVGVASGSLIGSLIAVLQFRGTLARWRRNTTDSSQLGRMVLVGAVMMCALAVAARAADTSRLRLLGSVLTLGITGVILWVRRKPVRSASAVITTV